jgi:hypothetical protein
MLSSATHCVLSCIYRVLQTTEFGENIQKTDIRLAVILVCWSGQVRSRHFRLG